MNQSLPPLNELHAFVIAARHLSFRDAAHELNLTPSAISQRIRALEERLKLPLFVRQTRSISLTPAGQCLFTDLDQAFTGIRQGLHKLERFNRSHNKTLTISTTTTFAEKWLLPRLAGFNQRYPQWDVCVLSGERLVDFQQDNIDLAIRFGRGVYSGLITEPLSAGNSVAVCSPQLLQQQDFPLRTVEDLQHQTLIETHWPQEHFLIAPSWESSLQQWGLNDLQPRKILGFNVDGLSIRAAINALGVALVHEVLVQDDLASGVLVRPFPELMIESVFRFHLVYPETERDALKTVQFREWLNTFNF
ncbi:MAG: LysR substrate-binding domain-containing protein [Thiolinea sp.]